MLTVFFSPDNWDGASSLAEIMTGAAEYGRYMVNIPCNLIVPARMSDQKCLQYGNTLAPIFLALKSAETKEEFEAVFNRYRKLFTSMPVEAFYVINSVLELDLQLDEEEYEGGTVNMCEAIRQIKESSKRQGIKLGRRQGIQKGRRQGIQKGIQKGRRQGISENQERTVLNLFDYGDGIEKIAAVLNLSEERIVKILRKHNRILSD